MAITHTAIVGRTLLWAWVVAIAPIGVRAADAGAEAAGAVDRAFADRIRTVSATRSPQDDVALAAEMLAIAGRSGDNPAVVVELCERVYLLAMRHGDGLTTAVGAMRMAMEHAPDRRAGFLDRAIAAQQRRYTAASAADRNAEGRVMMDLLREAALERVQAGDDTAAILLYKRALAVAGAIRAPDIEALRRELAETTHRPRLRARAEQLKQRLKHDPADASAARELIDLYMIDLDRPDEARKYTFLLADPPLERRVRLAATPSDQLDAPSLIEVGDHYRSLYAAATPEARDNVLARAYTAYARWLDGAAPDDPARTRVAMAHRDVAGQLTTLGVDPRSLYRPAFGNRITVTAEPVRDLEGHTGEWVSSLAFSADGRTLVSAGQDRSVRIWDADTGRATDTLTHHDAPVFGVAFSPDGQSIASIDEAGRLVVYGFAAKRPRARIEAPAGAHDLAWSPEGDRIAVAADGGARLFALANPRQPAAGPAHEGALWTVAISPNGRLLASGGEDRVVRIADAATGKSVADLAGHSARVTHLRFTADGSTLISSSEDGTIRVWDTEGHTSLGLVDRIDTTVRRVDISADGKLLAAACYDGDVRIYDLHHRTLAAQFRAHRNRAFSVAFSPDGGRLATGGTDRAVRLWSLTRREAPTGEAIARPIPPRWFTGEGKHYILTDNGARLALRGDGGVSQGFFAHADGRYEVRLRAYAELAGDAPPIVAVAVDELEAVNVAITANADAPAEYTARFTLARGWHTLRLTFTNDFFDKKIGDRNANVLGVQAVGLIDAGAR